MTFRTCLALLGVAASSAIWMVACVGSVDPDAGGTDASVVDGSDDSGESDSGESDSGASDSGVSDSSASDSGVSDSSASDSASSDSGVSDSGASDSASSDSASADSAAADSGTAADGGDAGGGFGTVMSFFVSSTPVFDTVGSASTGDVSGDGDLIFTVPATSPPVVLRGTAAADAHCQSRAVAVGNPRPNWVAYLSTHGLPEAASPSVSGPQIDARDRIGTGPWYNADDAIITDAGGTPLVNATFNVVLGVVLGEGRDANAPANRSAVDAYNAARPDEALVLTEAGTPLSVGVHDIFTGSDSDGTVYDGGYPERWFISQRTPPAGSRTRWGTCNDWNWQRFGSAPGTEFAQIGHTDIASGGFSPTWNSAHDTQNCTQSGVASRGGAGHVYCFSPD